MKNKIRHWGREWGERNVEMVARACSLGLHHLSSNAKDEAELAMWREAFQTALQQVQRPSGRKALDVFKELKQDQYG